MAFAQNPVTLNNTGNILYLGNNITKLGSNLTIGTSPVANQQFYFLGNGNITGNLIIGGNLDFYGNLLQNGIPYVGSQWTTQDGNIYYMGNVGINMVSPIYPLDVVGDANISSNLYVSNVYIRENCVIQSGDFSILNGNLSVYKNFNAFGESFLSGNLTIYNSDIYNYGNIYTYNGLYINKNGALYTQNETSGQHALYTYDTVNSMTTLFGGADDTNRVGYMGVGGYGTSLPLILNPLGGNVGINNGNPRQRLDVAGSANISGSIFAAGQTVNITESTVTIKSVSGLGSVQQLLNFDTHGSGRGGGILFTQPDTNVKQFLGRGYIGNTAITSISYNTTTTGESVYHSGTTSSGNVTKMSLTDTGDMALAGTLRIGANANVIGNLGITGNLIGTSNIILLNGRLGIGKSDPLYELDLKGTANVSGNIFVNGLNLGMGIPGYYYPNVRTMSLFHNTNNGSIGFNYPNPECMLLMTNLGGGLLSWGMYMGVVKDVAATNPVSSLRLDLGSTQNLATNVNNAGANTIVPRVSIRYHGNAGIMGINRTNPMYALDVNGTANITGNMIMNANANVIGNLGITGNLIGTSNIILLNGRLGVGMTNPQQALDVAGSANISGNILIGTPSYTMTNGTSLIISQNSIFDNSVVGTINGNVYPQLSFGANREHIFSVDAVDANISYFGITGGGAPDSDYFITYKRATGMKISDGTYDTSNFTEALKVVGTANITGNMIMSANANVLGNLGITGNLIGTSNIILLNGNMGLRTTTTNATLDVNGNVLINGNLNVDNGLFWTDPINNRVGILNTNPQYDLDVKGTANVSGNIYANGLNLGLGLPGLYYPNVRTISIPHNTYNGSIGFNFPNPECMFLMTNLGSNIFEWGMYMGVVKDLASTSPINSIRLDLGSTQNLATNVNNAGANTIVPRVSIRYHGNTGIMGINRTNPMYALDVNGTANISGSIIMSANANVLGNLGVTGNIIGTSNIILLNGNMGLGTTTMNATLDVNGNARISGNLNVDNGTLWVDATNNRVGINNTNPQYAFDVKGDSNITGSLYVGGATPIESTRAIIRNTTVDTATNGTTSGTSVNVLGLNAASRIWYYGSDGANNSQFYFGTSGGDATNPDYFCYWDTGGKMMLYPAGTATITPPNSTDLFTVQGNANIVGNILFTGSVFQNGVPVSLGSQWTTSGANIYYNVSNGNVGIGTISPVYPLDISGNTRMNGNLIMSSGNIFLSTGSNVIVNNGANILFSNVTVPANQNFIITGGANAITATYIQRDGGVSIKKATVSSSYALDINGNQLMSGVLVTTDTSDTTSLGTGSMRTAGGISISKNANVGANIFGGNLLIQNNVGITTLTPGANLDVVGNARISGNVNIDNGLFWTDPVNNRVGILNTNPQYALDVKGVGNVSGNVFCDGISTFSGQTAFKIDYGITALATNGTVTFNTTFTNPPIVTTGMLRNGDGAIRIWPAVTTTGFTWYCYNMGGGLATCQVQWMAIGM